MKLTIHFQKTALYIAVEKENVEIVKLLIAQPNIDINIPYIFIQTIKQNSNSNQLMKFQSKLFNNISIQII